MMQKEELGLFAALLNKQKEDLLKGNMQSDGIEEYKSLRDGTQELSTIDNHPADLASENYERGKDLSLREKNEQLLLSINAALTRIAEGTYGLCFSCQKEIPRERLEAIPYTEYCLPCRQELENKENHFSRPLEEELLESPFARTDTDGTDSTAYDGEDSGDDVTRHNKRSHIYEDGLEDENSGVVEKKDNISNDEYKEQLP